MDWTATILAAAKTNPDPDYPLDGHDLLPVIRGEREIFERRLFWRFHRQDAMRKGKWKYLNDGEEEYLFNMAIDERERADFKEQNPEIFDQLRKEYRKLQAEMLHRPK